MNPAKRKRLESAGWKVGSADQFLGLTREEAEVVEVKLTLSDSLRRHRLKQGMTQSALAKRLGSSQSRVAKLEAGAPGITLDLLFRALFTIGVTPLQIAREIQNRRRLASAS